MLWPQQLVLALSELGTMAGEVAAIHEIALQEALTSLLQGEILSPQKAEAEKARLKKEMEQVKARIEELETLPGSSPAEILSLQRQGKLYGTWFRVIRMQEKAGLSSEEGTNETPTK